MAIRVRRPRHHAFRPQDSGLRHPWYEYAIQTAQTHALAHDLEVLIVTAPVFLATKLAAYEGRGGGDLLFSHDVEDVVNVLAFRSELAEELDLKPVELRRWVATKVREYLIQDPLAEAAVSGNLPDARIAPELIPRTMDRLRAIADLAGGRP